MAVAHKSKFVIYASPNEITASTASSSIKEVYLNKSVVKFIFSLDRYWKPTVDIGFSKIAKTYTWKR